MNTALILAAGRGERLRPLTDRLPKALCVVNHKPLIEHHVTRLAEANFTRIIINHAHLGDQIKRHLGDGSRFNVDITYSAEPPGALETLGAILNAKPFFEHERHLVTVNADIVTDFDYKRLQPNHAQGAHLILIPLKQHQPQGDFALLHHQQVKNSPKDYIFSGIACFDLDLFNNMKLMRTSIVPWLQQWADTGQLTGELHHGIWFDTGTPKRLLEAQHAFD